MKRKFVLFCGIALLVLLTFGAASHLMARQSGHTGNQHAAESQPQSAPRPAAQLWEYRVLRGDLIPGLPRSDTSLQALEQQINTLADQGFQVESFQPEYSDHGSAYPVITDSHGRQKTTSWFGSLVQVYVLMKRPKT